MAVVDDSTDAGDVAPHRRVGGRRGLAGEHRVRQPIHGHDGVGVDEEHGQEPPLAGPTDRDRFTALRDCQPTQRDELDHGPLPSVGLFYHCHPDGPLWQTCGSDVADAPPALLTSSELEVLGSPA